MFAVALGLGLRSFGGMLALGAALALWGSVRRHPSAYAVGRGVAAAVVGLLAAALWDPVVRSAVHGVADVVALGLLLLLFRVLPAWAVVAVGALGGAILL